MLLRITRAQNMLALSPTRRQVAEMAAPECIPLVMEPESKMYDSPVAVLDFQSLYPSIMIAYNYCYSTCLGRVAPTPAEGKKLGVSSLAIPPGALGSMEEHITGAQSLYLFCKLNELFYSFAEWCNVCKARCAQGRPAAPRTRSA